MNTSNAVVDPEMAEFEAALMRSIDQTTRGKPKLGKPHHKITLQPR